MGVTVATIEKEVAFFLGYGYTATASGQHGDFLNNIAYRAMQQFVIPPVLPGENSAHKWSWLKSTGIIALQAPVTYSQAAAADFLIHSNIAADDCPQVANGVVRLGLDTSAIAAAFPDWIHTGDGGSDQVGAVVEVAGMGTGADGYHIPTAVANVGTTDFTFTLADTAVNIAESEVTTVTSGVQSGVSFTFYNGMAPGGTSFGAVDGTMTYNLNSGIASAQVVNIEALRDLFANKPVRSGPPEYAAWDEALARFLFYPLPDKAYTLRYKYTKDVNLNATGTGGADDLDELIPQKYEGTVVNGALALAELYAPEAPSRGRFQEVFSAQLRAAVFEDRANHRVEYFGKNNDRSDFADMHGRESVRDIDAYYTNRAGTRYPS
jgi:hypothetical protein